MIDETGEWDLDQRENTYQDWVRRYPESREAENDARLTGPKCSGLSGSRTTGSCSCRTIRSATISMHCLSRPAGELTARSARRRIVSRHSSRTEMRVRKENYDEYRLGCTVNNLTGAAD